MRGVFYRRSCLAGVFTLTVACGDGHDWQQSNLQQQGQQEVESYELDNQEAVASLANFQFNTTVEWAQPSQAEGFGPAEPYTAVARFKNSTYVVWVDANQRAWLTQITNGNAVVVPLDANPDYLVQADGHHRFSLGIDKKGYIHVTGDMHHYSTFSDKVITPYPARYQKQAVLYWKSNQPENISAGFYFAGGKNAASKIPGSGWMMGRFFTNNSGELYYSSMVHAYESPAVQNKGQMAVGLYRYNTDTAVWTALGGLADLPKDPYITNVEKVFFWENSGMNGGWFQNYQARFHFDAMNRLHFAVSGNTNPTYAGADRVFYAMSPDGGVTWKKANGTVIPGLPLRGKDGFANLGDIVVDSGAASTFLPDMGVVADRNGNPAVSVRLNNSHSPLWYTWNGTSWVQHAQMSKQLPWGAPGLAYRIPGGDLFFFGFSPGMLYRTSEYNQPFLSHQINLPLAAGNIANVDEATLRDSGVVYNFFATSDKAAPVITKTTFAAAPLPSGWQDTDVTTRTSGYLTSSAFFGDTFTSYDFGVGSGTKDDVHFTYRPLACDGALVARVASTSLPVPGSPRAGLMMRESMAIDARLVSLSADLVNGKFVFAYRNTVGTYPIEINRTGNKVPTFLKLERKGNVFTGSMSENGQTWTQVGQTTLALSSNLQVGLQSAAGQHGYHMQTSTFKEVSLNDACSPPPPPPPTCVRSAPKVTISPANQSIARGTSKSFTVAITNLDSAGCGRSIFGQTLTTSAPSGTLSKVVASYNLEIAPAASGSTTMTVKVGSAGVLGTYIVRDTVQHYTPTGDYPAKAVTNVTITP